MSSTFRDFHGEWEVLVSSVRAALDERIRPLGCRVELVDLRYSWIPPAARAARVAQQAGLDVDVTDRQ